MLVPAYLLQVLIMILAVVHGEGEPSKFDYDQKLLDKMIRLEFEVSRMLNESKEAMATVRKDLSDMRGLASQVSEYRNATLGMVV